MSAQIRVRSTAISTLAPPSRRERNAPRRRTTASMSSSRSSDTRQRAGQWRPRNGSSPRRRSIKRQLSLAVPGFISKRSWSPCSTHLKLIRCGVRSWRMSWRTNLCRCCAIGVVASIHHVRTSGGRNWCGPSRQQFLQDLASATCTQRTKRRHHSKPPLSRLISSSIPARLWRRGLKIA